MSHSFQVDELVPHSGSMSLLSKILDYGDEWLTAEVEITDASTFYDNGSVPAWIGLEYMAQAIGAYSGLQECLKGEKPKLGFLLGTRHYSCNVSSFPEKTHLLVKVERCIQGDNGLSVFQCTLSADTLLAEASLNVYQPDDAEKFIEGAI